MTTDPSQFPQMNMVLFPEGTKFLHRQDCSHEEHLLAKLPNGTIMEIISHGRAPHATLDVHSGEFVESTLGMGDLLQSAGLKLKNR